MDTLINKLTAVLFVSSTVLPNYFSLAVATVKEIGPSWEAPEDFDCSRRLDLRAEADWAGILFIVRI